MATRTMHALSPPAYGHPDDDSGEERPPFVLMEPHAYFADRDNATTATCEMSGFRGKFKVTFCTARPPLVSYMCFHATEYKHTDFTVEPHVVATETDGGLALLRVVFADHLTRTSFPQFGEYLVYDASGPSLAHLPIPTNVVFIDETVAFLRVCTQGQGASHGHDYVLAAHSGCIGFGDPSDLYMYHSDANTWITKQLVVKQPFSDSDPLHSTCKAITIGGAKGIVAWVDLWHNIIMSNVLSKRPKIIHCLELPDLPPEDTSREARSIRDIALLDGMFKFVEIQFYIHGHRALDYWEARVWSANPGSALAKEWIVEYQLRSFDIPELPMLRVDPGRAQPTFSTLHTGLPNLGLQNDGMVYYLSKVYHCNNDHVAWVLAVDMRNKTIHKVGEFRPTRTLGLGRGYSATRISKYLKGTKQKKC